MSMNASTPSNDINGNTNNVENMKLDGPVYLPARTNHRALDITHDFILASEALHVGQLIKDEAFSLFDAVQAIEIMDPKMDTGYLEPGETFDEDYDVSRTLLPEEIIWIMDQLLCYQAAWHQGYSLSQNVLTSLYIDNLLSTQRPSGHLPIFRNSHGKEPNEITARVLAPFCIGLIKSCDMTIEIIQSSQYYEEEDFNTQTFNKDLLTDFLDEDYWNFQLECEEWLKRQYDTGILSQKHCEALLARLKLNIKLLEVVLPNPGAEIAGNDFLDSSFGGLSNIILKTHDLGKPVPEAFSPKMQRKLASTVPPRPVATVPFEQAITLVQKLRQDLDEAVLVDGLEQPISIREIEAYLWAFSSREALALPRAVLQMFLFGDGKLAAPTQEGVQTLLWTELYSHAVMENFTGEFWEIEHSKDPRYVVAKMIDGWREDAMGVFSDVLRSLCQNPCRMRRCLANMLQEVDALNAKLLETHYQDPKFDFPKETLQMLHIKPDLIRYTRWLLVTVTQSLQQRVVDWILTLGFEQNIYRDDELAAMYHYKFTQSSYVRNKTEAMIEVGKRHHLSYVKQPDSMLYLTLLERERLEGAEETVMHAMSTLYLTLTTLGAFPRPPPPSSTDPSLQFTLRMRPFTSQITCPMGPSLLSFLQEAALGTPPSNLLHALTTALAGIKDAIADLGRLKANKAELESFLRSVGLAATDATLEYWRARVVELHREGFLVSMWCMRLKEGVEKYGVEGLKGRVVVEMPKTRNVRFLVLTKVLIT